MTAETQQFCRFSCSQLTSSNSCSIDHRLSFSLIHVVVEQLIEKCIQSKKVVHISYIHAEVTTDSNDKKIETS